MQKNSLYTTAEIDLVLRLYANLKQGKKLHITEQEHQFLRQQFESTWLMIYDRDTSAISYRSWYLVCRETYFTTNRREVANRLSSADHQLYREVEDATDVQTADVFRSLIYDGLPIEVLVQCAIIEMCYRLNLIPRRASEVTWGGGNTKLIELADELQRNGTFNI